MALSVELEYFPLTPATIMRYREVYTQYDSGVIKTIDPVVLQDAFEDLIDVLNLLEAEGLIECQVEDDTEDMTDTMED